MYNYNKLITLNLNVLSYTKNKVGKYVLNINQYQLNRGKTMINSKGVMNCINYYTKSKVKNKIVCIILFSAIKV